MIPDHILASRQKLVGFTIHCLRNLAVAPSLESMAQVRSLFEEARNVVSPSQAFPAWVLNVCVASFMILLAEGEPQAAKRAIAEVATFDSQLGGGLLADESIRAQFDALSAKADAMGQSVAPSA